MSQKIHRIFGMSSRQWAIIAAAATTAAAAAAAYALRVWEARRRQRPATVPSLVLTYLDIPGFAEPIRLVLAVGGVAFEDRRVGYDEVARLRLAGDLPNGQVPVLHIDSVPFGQSAALLRWAGRVAGLAPPHLQLRVDMIEETMTDLRVALRPQWYGNALGRSPRTGELIAGAALTEAQRLAVESALNEDVLPVRLAQLEGLLLQEGNPGPYFCGEVLTTCDLSFYCLAEGLTDGSYCAGVSRAVLGGFPALLELAARVGRLPAVRAWNAHANAKEGARCSP